MSNHSDERDPLLAQVRRLQPSDAAVARAWQRLQTRGKQPATARGWRVWFASASVGTLAMIAALLWWSHAPQMRRHDAIVMAPEANGTVAAAQLFALQSDDVQASLLGPGRVALGAGHVTLLSGALIGSATRPVVIEARDVKVHVPARAVFEVRILSTGVVVAAWQGDLAVLRAGRAAETLHAGQRMTETGTEAIAMNNPVRAPEPEAVRDQDVGREPMREPEPVREAEPVREHATAPKPIAPPAVATKPAGLDEKSESAVLQRAISTLRRDRDPAKALAQLDAYASTFPTGALRTEARLVRIDSLLALGNKTDALVELDSLRDEVPRAELRLVRAELRAHARRYADALADLRVIDHPPLTRDRERGPRLVWALAVCYAELGDHAAKRQALERYLSEFPEGAHAKAAKTALDAP